MLICASFADSRFNSMALTAFKTTQDLGPKRRYSYCDIKMLKQGLHYSWSCCPTLIQFPKCVRVEDKHLECSVLKGMQLECADSWGNDVHLEYYWGQRLTIFKGVTLKTFSFSKG